MKSILEMIAEDKSLSPAMRRAFAPTMRETCHMCDGNRWLADPYGPHVQPCTTCAGRGYVITEAK